MFIYIRNLKKLVAAAILIIFILVAAFILKSIYFDENQIAIGAFIHSEEKSVSGKAMVESDKDETYEMEERFQRPSKLAALKLKYNFVPKDDDKGPPYIADGFPQIYQSPEDVIQAYYAILKNAANMQGYSGGCGTILWMNIPYPYAYTLFSDDLKENLTLEEFKDSFKGTGAMNLLHLEPAYEPKGTPDNIKHYFTEVEVLKGHKEKGQDETVLTQPNYFEYYYGIITTEYTGKQGWKIKSIDYLPEIYLCHPLHGWNYYYDVMIDIIYNGWYGMNLKIDYTEIENNYLKVYASNSNEKYRFDFVRLTNGDDVLLHEYVKENDEWKETSILKPDSEKYFKIFADKFNNE